MAKEKEEKAAEKEKPRRLGEGEAIERSTVDPEKTDIFEEVLSGTGKERMEEARAAIDRNEEEMLGEEDSGEEESDEEDDEGPAETKNPAVDEEEAKAGEFEEDTLEDEEEPRPRKRGRPAKKKKPVAGEENESAAENKPGEEDEETAEGVEEEMEEEGKGGTARDSNAEGEERNASEWNDEEFDYDVDHDAKEPRELKAPAREEIMKTILEKASAAAEGAPAGETEGSEKLSFLADKEKNSVFIGRKASIHKRYGYEAALHIGRVQEKEFENNEVYLDSLNPHVVFVCGARGSGKCLTEDTLITLDNGEVIPIKELENRNEKVFALGSHLNVQAVERTEFFRRTVNKTLRVKLKSGREIELTPEHPLLTVNGWRFAEDLPKGERIATPRVLPAFGSDRMKECDVKLLAYLIAEGHLSNQFVLFSNFDEKIITEFKQSVVEFDPNLRIEQHSKPGCFRVAQVKKKVDLSHIVRDPITGRFTDEGYIHFEKSSIRQWLESVGLYGKLSAEKFIPKEVMRLEKKQLALFLNRLFSCDGSIFRANRGKSWCVTIGFASERMTKEAQHLLLRFGILSTLRKKKIKLNGQVFNNYEVTVYGENVIKFVNEIGFYGEKEQREVIAVEEMSELNRNPNFDTVPKEIWQKFIPYNAKEMSRKLGYKSNWFHSAKSYAPSRAKLLKMAQYEQNIGIQVLANSDIYWDTIKEITEINEEKEVYDITVPMHHNFVANDIVVHNSYVLGVVAEELAEKNKNVGMIVVDPIGVFWSMRFPNKEEREIEKLREWGLKPEGLNNLKVFIPEGIKGQVPKSTYDSGFSIQPSLLTGEDWALTFGVDRFSVSGLLLEKALKKVEKGYTQSEHEDEEEGKKRKGSRKVPGKGSRYSLADLIECLETDSELNSREKGYKQDSIRAIVSRFEAAKGWGIFHKNGTPLGELSREGQLTVLDTSFLDDNVTALVIGILARRLLAARKISTRKEAANQFKELSMNELLELEVPPTWLFIDEAHTLIPSGNEVTPATAGLIEYVKQGRRPGLSLVFATQQPSAINTKVLSQLDIIMTHKLIFDDDIKAVFKRTPTIIPHRYRAPNFIKTLPVGVALTGDRSEETSRAFVMGVRPRKSQHEGRDAETTQMAESLDDAQVMGIATELLARDVKAQKTIDMDTARLAVETLNIKYRSRVSFASVLKALEAAGMAVGKTAITMPGASQEGERAETGEESEEEPEERGESKEETPAGEETTASLELLALPQRISEEQARRMVDGIRKKGFLGLVGQSERMESISLKYFPIWRVMFDSMTQHKEFIARECFINSVSGEFIHFRNGEFVESRGLRMVNRLSHEEISLVKLLQKREMLAEELMANTGLDEARVTRTLQQLWEKGVVQKMVDARTGRKVYRLKEKLDLPPHERHELLGSLANLPFVKTEALSVERETIGKEEATAALRKLWGSIVVKRVEPLYKPVWHAVLSLDAKEREVLVDAVNGKLLRA